MRFYSVASLCTVAVAAFLLAPNNVGATSTMSAPNFSKSAGAFGLLEQVKCEIVDNHLTCTKKSKKDNDDKGTKTVKLIKDQKTCTVSTPGTGGGGCTSPLIYRCDKLKDGDQVCCCYHVDDSKPVE